MKPETHRPSPPQRVWKSLIAGLIPTLVLGTAMMMMMGQTVPPAPSKPPAAAPPPASQPAAAPAPVPRPDPSQVDPAPPQWQERMPKDDRAALEELLGYAPPPFGENLKWIGASPATWPALQGKVVVLQSWSTGNTAARNWPARIAATLKEFTAKDLRILALHTPDNAAGAENFMQKQKPPPPQGVDVIIDSTGSYCDALGIYKHPVNIVVDRNGAVRYVGLNASGLQQAVAALVEERFDPAKAAQPRPQGKPAATQPSAEFPPITGPIRYAKDIRGKRAPEFFVEEWITPRPNAEGKVVMVEFWGTGCAVCITTIPHINDLASRFSERVCFVGVSQEKKFDFEEGLRKRKLKEEDFRYSLALDRGRKMSSAIQLSAIPHCIVMSRDWIVRWQGDPGELKPETLEQIIKADAATISSTVKPSGGGKRRGWATGAKSD